MDQTRPPHEILIDYVGDTLGRRRQAFGATIAEDLFEKLVLGVTDQLSAYQQCCTGAKLRVGQVTLRHGATRSYIVAPIEDRRSPLRLRDAMRRWDMIGSSNAMLVLDVNSRRWNFVDRNLHRVLDPLLRQIADRLIEYYGSRPHAKRTVGMIRFIEDVHRTVLVAEIDERNEAELGKADAQSRYLMQ